MIAALIARAGFARIARYGLPLAALLGAAIYFSLALERAERRGYDRGVTDERLEQANRAAEQADRAQRAGTVARRTDTSRSLRDGSF